MYLVGMASILGEVFSLSAQHEGNIIQNIVPIESDANEQMGTGSKVFLEFGILKMLFTIGVPTL